MKKIIALSAIACAALVGCATNEPEALDTTETAEGFREGKFGKPFVVPRRSQARPGAQGCDFFDRELRCIR